MADCTFLFWNSVYFSNFVSHDMISISFYVFLLFHQLIFGHVLNHVVVVFIFWFHFLWWLNLFTYKRTRKEIDWLNKLISLSSRKHFVSLNIYVHLILQSNIILWILSKHKTLYIYSDFLFILYDPSRL